MSVEWSPDDTKAELIEVCEELGIDAHMGMLKAEIIALLEDASEPDDELSVMTSAEDKEESYKTDASFTGDPKPPIPDPPKPQPPKKPKGKSVITILRAAKDRVSLDELVKQLGPGAIKEVKQLIKQGKVCQHRKGVKFWFIAND